jgi:hypothetical protein
MAFTDVLKKAYPFLSAAASLVPGGNIAATALGQILNLKSGATLDDAGLALMTATPEQRAQLQAEDNRHKEAITQMGFANAEEFERIAAADRASARDREKTVKDWMPRVLGIGIVAGFLTAVFLILTGHAKAESVIAGTLIGYLSAKAEGVVTYYFGSSAGSAEKTRLLAQAQPISDQK